MTSILAEFSRLHRDTLRPGQTSVLFQPLSPDLLVLALTAALMGAMVNFTVAFVSGSFSA